MAEFYNVDAMTLPSPYREIFEKYLPEWAEEFLKKAIDYDDTYKHLGSKGQFSDINRKFWKLKRAVWDGKELVGEGVYEICQDIISHALLLIACIEEGI